MVCAEKQLFVHTLATAICRTVVLGVAIAISQRFVLIADSWVSMGSANDSSGEERERFFADAQNDSIVNSKKVSLVQLLRFGVNAGERLF